MTDYGKKAPGQKVPRSHGIVGMTLDGSPVMLRPAPAPAQPPAATAPRTNVRATTAETDGMREYVSARSARMEAARLKAEFGWWVMSPAQKAEYATQHPERFLTPDQRQQWQQAGGHPAYVADDGSIRFPLSYAEWMSRLAEEDY